MKIEIRTVGELLINALLNKKFSREEAEIVADDYLEGELLGKPSHGLMAFPGLIEKLDGKRQPYEIIKQSHSCVLIDAKESHGAYVGRKAADMAIDMSEREGVGVALIKDQMTWLRPGGIAQYVADRGYIGIVMNNGGKPMMAPPGGYDPVIGTNPIGIGIPTDADPIVADMATSIKAWGEVKMAENEKRKLPEDMFLDNQGAFAANPEDAYSVLPAGGYKGFAFGLLVEILTGSFLGRLMGPAQMNSDYKKLTRGGVILVLNSNFGTTVELFRSANSELVNNIRSSRKLKDVDEILVPGERALRTKRAFEKDGCIDIDNTLWERLEGSA